MEYKHRDVRVSTSAGDLASDCPQSEKDLCREENNAESESVGPVIYSESRVNFFFLTSHPPTTMSQFQS